MFLLKEMLKKYENLFCFFETEFTCNCDSCAKTDFDRVEMMLGE